MCLDECVSLLVGTDKYHIQVSDPADSVFRSWRHKQKYDWLGCTLFNWVSWVELCRYKHPFTAARWLFFTATLCWTHWQGQLRMLFEHVSSEDEAICVGLDCTADGSGSLLQMYPTLSLPHLSVLASWLIHLTAGEFLRRRACDGWPLHVQRSTLYNRAKLDAILYWENACCRSTVNRSIRADDGWRTYVRSNAQNECY